MDQLVDSKTIYALYAIPEDDCATIHAISFSKDSLQYILEELVPT